MRRALHRLLERGEESEAELRPRGGILRLPCWVKVLRRSLLGLLGMRPLRIAVREKLLQHVEAHFPVVQRVSQVAAFENPRRGNPTERQVEEALDLARAARAGVGQDGYV